MYNIWWAQIVLVQLVTLLFVIIVYADNGNLFNTTEAFEQFKRKNDLVAQDKKAALSSTKLGLKIINLTSTDTQSKFNNENISSTYLKSNRSKLSHSTKFSQANNPQSAGIDDHVGQLETTDLKGRNRLKRGKINNNGSELHKRSFFYNQDQDPEWVARKPTIYSLRCDTCEIDEGAIVVKAHSRTTIFLIGRDLYSNVSVGLTKTDGEPRDDCTHMDRVSFSMYNSSLNVAKIDILLPSPGAETPYYFCLRDPYEVNANWFHQGTNRLIKVFVKQDIIPLYGKLIIIVCLLSLSGTFSGLNLGLMALDKNDLQVIMKCGSETEKRYARVIEPVRRRGNYLLCSILFSNTLVNSTISVLLEELSDGLIAIMASTILIVLFGEILPQAFCSRHGLAVGAKTVWLTNFCMFITFPLSYPVSWCLDLALGDEIGHAYDRERLMEFIQVTRNVNNLEADEVNIISGALKIKRVQIREIMTKIDDVYMLDETSVLDFETIQAIVEKGYSRIPVHEAGNRNNIVAVLFAKDLALVDPDDKTPVQTLITFYNHPRMFVFEDTTLDTALNEFKSGKSHMAIVQRVIDDGDRDPFYENTGIVTLEDVIEEIMQMEINDETDTLTDNRRKRRRKEAQVRKDFSQFTNLGSGDSSFNVVTPQHCLAAYLYLATTVEPFSSKHISDLVLKRLLSQKIFYRVKVEDDEKQKRLFTAGQPADYFIMILEGRVHVVCGKENLFYDGGPFSFFGIAALTGPRDSMDQSDTNISMEIPSQSRRDSMVSKPGRRESITKALTGHLSHSTKKLAEPLVETDANSSPVHSAIALNEISPSRKLPKATNYFVPDYTVNIISNTSYLKVTSNDYVTALKATALERSNSALVVGEIDEIESRPW